MHQLISQQNGFYQAKREELGKAIGVADRAAAQAHGHRRLQQDGRAEEHGKDPLQRAHQLGQQAKRAGCPSGRGKQAVSSTSELTITFHLTVILSASSRQDERGGADKRVHSEQAGHDRAGTETGLLNSISHFSPVILPFRILNRRRKALIRVTVKFNQIKMTDFVREKSLCLPKLFYTKLAS